MFQPLSALVFFSVPCNSVDELMSAVHSALLFLSPMCAALVCFAAICNSVDELMSAVHILALPCIAVHCRPLQCRWLFNGSGSLFSLVCPFEGAAHVSASLRAGFLFRSLQFR